MKIEKHKCLECGNVYIDCRDLIFCTYKGTKYIGRKKDYTTPSWCPKEQKMKKYKINWIAERFGESFTMANSKKEARANAEIGLDYDFQDIDFMGNWQIETIEKAK